MGGDFCEGEGARCPRILSPPFVILAATGAGRRVWRVAGPSSVLAASLGPEQVAAVLLRPRLLVVSGTHRAGAGPRVAAGVLLGGGRLSRARRVTVGGGVGRVLAIAAVHRKVVPRAEDATPRARAATGVARPGAWAAGAALILGVGDAHLRGAEAHNPPAGAGARVDALVEVAGPAGAGAAAPAVGVVVALAQVPSLARAPSSRSFGPVVGAREGSEAPVALGVAPPKPVGRARAGAGEPPGVVPAVALVADVQPVLPVRVPASGQGTLKVLGYGLAGEHLRPLTAAVPERGRGEGWRPGAQAREGRPEGLVTVAARTGAEIVVLGRLAGP